VSGRLYLSFWDISLDNLPYGPFEHGAITTAEAGALIRTARATKTLLCVSKEDLLAPYKKRERRRHEELCAVLRTRCDCPLDFEDFLTTFEDEKPAVQSITPLQIAELQPGERLLVVTCSYRLADSVERDVDPEQRFVLTDDSLAFHVITALFPPATPPAT
jgi:hypothetical protein